MRTRFAEFGHVRSSNITTNMFTSKGKKLDSATPGTGVFISNDPFDLAVTTILSMNHRYTPTQLEGDMELVAWLTNHRHIPIDTNNDLWDENEMLKLCQIFGKIYFLSWCQIPAPHLRLTFKWQPGLLQLRHAYGQTVHHRNGRTTGYGVIQIQIDPGDYSAKEGVDSHMTAICSTLLHELIHAYLISYCCDGYHSSAGNCTRKNRELWSPGDGHCIAWFHLACAIERHAAGIDGAVILFKPSLSALRSYLMGLQRGEMLLLAHEWRRFLTPWDGASKLFDRLTAREASSLGSFLDSDPLVMQVWIEAVEEHDEEVRQEEDVIRQENERSRQDSMLLG